MPRQPIAVVTMTYNEATLLPVWLKHYAAQVGPENCYVIDHGSDDGSTQGLAANVTRWPRCPHDEHGRALAVRDFCASLFYAYERVLYTDVDEIVLADPRLAPTLTAYVSGRALPPVVDLFGVDLLHDGAEDPIDLDRPITVQRSLVRPFSMLCKPTLVAERIDWHVGFHFSILERRPRFAGLFLFHLAYVDDGILLERQRKRNGVVTCAPEESHHAVPPDVMLRHIREDYLGLPRSEWQMLDGERAYEEMKARFSAAIERKQADQPAGLWSLPARFRGTF